MQRVLKRASDEPVFVHEIVSPLRVYRLLQRAVWLLRLEDLNTSRVNAWEILRAKFDKRRANTLYGHWLWIMMRGEEDWIRAHSQGLFSTTRRDLTATGLYPVVAEPLALKIKLPIASSMAEKHWIRKLKPSLSARQTRYR